MDSALTCAEKPFFTKLHKSKGATLQSSGLNQLTTNLPPGDLQMKCSWMILFCAIAAISGNSRAQTPAPEIPAASACPILLGNLHVNTLSIRIRNTSGKKIVGLVFNSAMADAAEHWIWLRGTFAFSARLREFGWNKPIREGESKNLSWPLVNLEHEHSGGVALVLTSILFADGSAWDEDLDTVTLQIDLDQQSQARLHQTGRVAASPIITSRPVPASRGPAVSYQTT
jgi:hypothetical protein